MLWVLCKDFFLLSGSTSSVRSDVFKIVGALTSVELILSSFELKLGFCGLFFSFFCIDLLSKQHSVSQVGWSCFVSVLLLAVCGNLISKELMLGEFCKEFFCSCGSISLVRSDVFEIVVAAVWIKFAAIFELELIFFELIFSSLCLELSFKQVLFSLLSVLQLSKWESETFETDNNSVK